MSQVPETIDRAAMQMLETLRGDYPKFAAGEVWLVGSGPGDPGLLTLDAVAGLLQADVVVYDALVDPRILALARPAARMQFAGKRRGKPSIAQDAICEWLVKFARRGQRVLRLKGGDPFVFGRGGEEMLSLAAAQVPFRIVPGITAGLGALAAAQIPATMRGINQAITFVTGYSADSTGGVDWRALARTCQPIVLYMALHNLGTIVADLIDGGLPASTPVAVIASATLESQQILDSSLDRVTADLRATQMEAPAVVVVGEIVRTRRKLLAMYRQMCRLSPASSTIDA